MQRVLLIRIASDMGFTLGEIKLFLNGLRDRAPVGPRWRKLARQKIKKVAETIERSRPLKALLEHLLHCHCASLQPCVERLGLSPSLRLIPDRTNQRRLAKERRRKGWPADRNPWMPGIAWYASDMSEFIMARQAIAHRGRRPGYFTICMGMASKA